MRLRRTTVMEREVLPAASRDALAILQMNRKTTQHARGRSGRKLSTCEDIAMVHALIFPLPGSKCNPTIYRQAGQVP